MAKRINICLIGIGDVASALVQGIEKYKQHPNEIIGLLPEITQYQVDDFNFVLGFDVCVGFYSPLKPDMIRSLMIRISYGTTREVWVCDSKYPGDIDIFYDIPW